jgi:hypothetical protein
MSDVPVYRGYRYINALLSNLEGESLAGLPANARALSFRNRSDRAFAHVVVAWSSGNAQAPSSATISFPTPLKIEGAYDIYGQRLAAAGTVPSFPLTEWGGPVFFIEQGSSISAPAPLTTPVVRPGADAPQVQAPTEFKAAVTKVTGQPVVVKLSWKSNTPATLEASLQIWRKMNNGSFVSYANLNKGTTTFTDNVHPDVLKVAPVVYKVRSLGTDGKTSDFSAEVSVQ